MRIFTRRRRKNLAVDYQLTTGSDICCRRSVFVVGILFYIACDRCAVAVHDQQKIPVYHRISCCVVVLRPGRPEVRILPVALKKRIAMYFCNALFVLMLLGFRIILAAYHLPHRCTVLLPAVHFSVDLQWYA